MVIIDGVTYNIPVVSIKRNADFLDKYAERTEDGILHRELIGVYFNYQLQLGGSKSEASIAEYALLWAKLTEATEFHIVTVPDVEGDYTFTAYFSNVSDEVRLIKNDRNFWKNLTVNFIAKQPK